MLALSVAVVLAVFLLYVSLAGGGTPALQPSELKGRSEKVMLSGRVLAPVRPQGDAYRFRLRDPQGPGTVPVSYASGLPDQFKVGREVVLTGKLEDGTFVARHDSLVTLCPSKFSDQPGDTSPT